MLTFLPALILLLLHGPSNFERTIGQAGPQADIGARASATPAFVARHNRAWIAELLSRIPNEAFLAALELDVTQAPAALPAAPSGIVFPYREPASQLRAKSVQRDRDGPISA
jgi:hypothetical protein